MEEKSKRDWVVAALDQWDLERRLKGRRKVQKIVSSGLFVVFCISMLSFTQLQRSRQDSKIGALSSQTMARPKPSEQESLELAQNRVFGLMNGRQLRSRQHVSRLGKGVSRLSSRLGRK